MKAFTALILSVAGFVGAGNVFSANLLTNPGFDQATSMQGWTWIVETTQAREVCGLSPTCGNMRISNAECCGTAGSESVASDSGFPAAQALTQCVAGISADTAYDFGAWIRLTTTPGLEPGLPGVFVEWYGSNDCSGTVLGFTGRSVAPPAWSRTAVPTNIAPAGSQSALFMLDAGATGDSGTSVGMEFDGAFFGPAGTVPVELQSFVID